MTKYIAMVVICLAVSGLMYLIFARFFKRLKKIENDFWGRTSDEAGRELAEARAKSMAEHKHGHHN